MKKISLFFIILINFWTLSAHAADFTLTTSSFKNQSKLPIDYTCTGKNISPELAWTNPPANAKSFALILSDPDAPGGTFYHWVVYNIPATTKEFTEALTQLPTGAIGGQNSWGKTVYNGPCPPKGSTHRYIFTLYALDTTLNLPEGSEAGALLAAMKDHTLKAVTLNAVYGR